MVGNSANYPLIKYFKIFMIVCGSWVFSDLVTFIALVIFFATSQQGIQEESQL